MIGYEYKVVPAPTKGRKAPGIKGAEARFANAIEHQINELAADGWEYLRADILPSAERQGLTSTQTVYRTLLVFRRATAAQIATDGAGQAAEDAGSDEQDIETGQQDQADAAEEDHDADQEEAPQDPDDAEPEKAADQQDTAEAKT